MTQNEEIELRQHIGVISKSIAETIDDTSRRKDFLENVDQLLLESMLGGSESLLYNFNKSYQVIGLGITEEDSEIVSGIHNEMKIEDWYRLCSDKAKKMNWPKANYLIVELTRINGELKDYENIQRMW
ncbi:hypothetical protein GF345_01635 [Candidatus Woesearchaeota archaeon]|nr:hypothetical protein [Candidatus Woesearchaeota archaeon]